MFNTATSDMKLKKAKASTKQPAKKLIKRQQKPGNSGKAPAKGNARKRQVSDGSDDADSDDDASKRRQKKKRKHIEEVDDEENEVTEPEQIIECDGDIEVPEPDGNDKDDESAEQRQLDLSVELRVKKDTTKDLLTIFSARVTASATFFSELPPELFPIISAHLPLAYRPSTLLSLALTCHRLHEIVIPRLLYNGVRLVGEDQALSTLKMLIGEAQLVNEEEKGNSSLSHCIRRLCIESSIDIPIRTQDHSINALRKLIDMDGLRHLSDLSLHIRGEWDGQTSGYRIIDLFLTLPSSFFISLRTKCPHLKSVYLNGIAQGFRNECIEPELLSFESLTSIRVEGDLLNYPITPTIKFSQLPPNLHTLELRLHDRSRGTSYTFDVSGPGGLFQSVIPNLNTLILDWYDVSDSASATAFWRAHPGIERLELGRKATGSWFDNFEVGMLPNLRYLQCDVLHALVLLPHVSKSLIRLSLMNTYNAQGPYLLRALVPEGILPALRSLGIHRDSGDSRKPREGHRWRENENGGVSQANGRKSSRQFDGNYIMSISKAAPNLEELELMGTSDDTLNSITTSLSRFPKLQRLTLSGDMDSSCKPFFTRSRNWADYAGYYLEASALPETSHGSYAPQSFDEAARDLADGCRTLDVITMGNMIGELLIRDGPGLSVRIVRESKGGVVKELKRIRAWGNIIGKEEEW